MPDAEGLVGPLEYAVLEVLWEHGRAPVGFVLEEINRPRTREDELAYTTVMTVLVRLYDKGLLDREKVGRGFSYTPLFDEDGLVHHLGRREVEELLDRYGTVALAQFAAALEDVDPAVLERLTRLADRNDDRG